MRANGIASAVLFFCLLLAASAWDIRKRIIPDSLCVLIALTGLPAFTPGKLAGLLLGLPLLIAALGKEGGLGGGDVKLAAVCGFVLGLPAGCVGLILGLVSVLVWHFAANGLRRLRHRPITSAGTTALPLAPFLSAGFIAATFL